MAGDSLWARGRKRFGEVFSSTPDTDEPHVPSAASYAPSPAALPGVPGPTAADVPEGEPWSRWPSRDEIAVLVTHYLTGRRRQLRRHVETIEMHAERAGRRRLTIDVELPPSGAASIPWTNDQRLFFVPAAAIRKAPPTTKMDFRDEDGRSLPVLSRQENAQITYQALLAATQAYLKFEGRPAELLAKYIRGAVYATRWEYQSAHIASALGLVKKVRPELLEQRDAEFLRLYQLWRDLAANSIVWLGIAGVPGERRVIKFAYDVTLGFPSLWRRRPRWVRKRLRIEGVEEEHWIYDLGDGNERGFLSRAWNRLATTIGWAAYDITIDSLYLRNAESYHLQFEAPEGLEARDIRLRAELVDARGRPVRVRCHDNRNSAHLYTSGHRVRQEGPAAISVRVGRRGFLSYATLSSAVIAAMLLFYAHWHASVINEPEVAAAVLLLVPALLAVFIFRPGEHSLATRMLAGVRGILLAEGLLSAAAATALLEILPLGLDDQASAWRSYGVVATILAGILVVSWLVALDSAERARKLTRRAVRPYGVYLVLAVLLAFVVWAMVEEGPSDEGLDGLGEVEFALGLGALAAASSWLALFADAPGVPVRFLRHRRMVSVLLAAESVLAVTVVLALVGWEADLVEWDDLHAWAAVVAVSCLTALLLIEPARQIGVPRPLRDDEQRFVADVLYDVATPERTRPDPNPEPAPPTPEREPARPVDTDDTKQA